MTPNSHKFWHAEEERRLKDLITSGTPLQETAELLDRSSDAIIQKVKRLGLKTPESWEIRRKTTKGSFQTLSWVRVLLSDVKTLKDVDRIRRQVDQALDALTRSAAEGFEKSVQKG